MKNIEIWKDIEGFEGKYQVSNKGNVKTLARIVVNKGKHTYHRLRKEKILKNQKTTTGYWQVSLHKNVDKWKFHRIHRLVALHFIPNSENKPQVNHINGIKTDNRVENLEWVTNRENTMDAIRRGINFTHNNKITFKDAEKIRELRKNKKLTFKELGEIYKINKATISHIINNRTWKYGKQK